MNMKVEGPNKSSSASGTKKKDSVKTGDSTFGDMVTGGAKESEQASQTKAIAGIDALLSIQAAEDPTERAAKKRMRRRADTILDELEKMRLALLSGNLTVGHVIDIADVVASHREKIGDPELTALLDEIDVRAQVEMAKMRMALDKR